MSWVAIILTFALVDNVILSRLLGVCPSACMPPDMRAARIMGVIHGVLMSLSAVAGWAADSLRSCPARIQLSAHAGLCVPRGRACFAIQAIAQSAAPAFTLKATGVSLPEIAMNCAALGLVLITTRAATTLRSESLVAGLAAGAGYYRHRHDDGHP